MTWIRWGLGGFLVLLLLFGAGVGALYGVISNPGGSAVLDVPQGMVALDTPEGVALLDDAEGTADHEGLTEAFQTQEKGTWCGVASAVAVLNARGDDLDQSGYFTDDAVDVRSWWAVTFGGTPLTDLGSMIAAHGATTTIRHAAEEDLASFRAEVAQNLSRSGDWLIVNYDRAVVGEEGGGHISPLSAYDAETDRVLLLDTASYKYPPHWVSVAALYDAMNTLDSESGRSRGWVVIR